MIGILIGGQQNGLASFLRHCGRSVPSERAGKQRPFRTDEGSELAVQLREGRSERTAVGDREEPTTAVPCLLRLHPPGHQVLLPRLGQARTPESQSQTVQAGPRNSQLPSFQRRIRLRHSSTFI
jgi:hypothetical protein